MGEVITAKRQAFKAWIARHAVHHACQEADKVYKNIDSKSSEVYCLANQFVRE